jgi:hypothetical protein
MLIKAVKKRYDRMNCNIHNSSMHAVTPDATKIA